MRPTCTRRSEAGSPLHVKATRKKLACRALGRAGIRRRRRQDLLPRLPLDFAWDLLLAPLQAGILIAAAGSRFAARLERTGPPKFENVAILALQHRLLGIEPRQILLGCRLCGCFLTQGGIFRPRDALSSSSPAKAGEGDRPEGAVEGARASTLRKRHRKSMMRKLVCFPFAATQTPPPPRFAWSPSPASRGRMKSAVVLATHPRPSFVQFFSPQSKHGCPRRNRESLQVRQFKFIGPPALWTRNCDLRHLNRLTYVPWTALRMKAGRRSADRRNVSLSARRASKCCHLACARGALVLPALHRGSRQGAFAPFAQLQARLPGTWTRACIC